MTWWMKKKLIRRNEAEWSQKKLAGGEQIKWKSYFRWTNWHSVSKLVEADIYVQWMVIGCIKANGKSNRVKLIIVVDIFFTFSREFGLFFPIFRWNMIILREKPTIRRSSASVTASSSISSHIITKRILIARKGPEKHEKDQTNTENTKRIQKTVKFTKKSFIKYDFNYWYGLWSALSCKFLHILLTRTRKRVEKQWKLEISFIFFHVHLLK